MEKKNNNSSKWPFQILVPHKPEGTEISVKEAEKILLEQLDASNNKQDIEQALWELACFYSKTGRQSIALQYVKQLADGTEDPNKAAACYMAMGQLMEQIHDYESAILFYTQAVLLEPTVTYTAYFINNNLGYSLNRVGKHDEAEKYCREAITIDPQRHNAYKNLGLSLEGQGKFVEAAQAYIKAVQANAGDSRALQHLECLIENHKEIMNEMQDLPEQLKCCRKVVNAAHTILRNMNEDKDN